MTPKNLSKRKIKVDLVSKAVILLFSLLSISTLLVLFFMILQASFPAYENYGFFHMYFTADFSESGGYGIWKGLLITLITSTFAVLFATPIALRTAIFLKWRVKHGRKFFKILANILAGVPSVIFGVFALGSFSVISKYFLNTESAMTILNASLILTIMIFPTLLSLIYNQLNAIPEEMLNSSIALGNTQTHAIYTVGKKHARSGVYVAVIVALGRAIGETMALSMILPLSTSGLGFSWNIIDFFSQGASSLGVSIAKLFYTDSSDELVRSALFAAGVALFVIVMILTVSVNKLSQKRVLKNENPFAWKKKFDQKQYPTQTIKKLAVSWYFFTILPRIMRYLIVKFLEKIVHLFQAFKRLVYLFCSFLFLPKKQAQENYDTYLNYNQSFFPKLSSYTRVFLEILCFSVLMGSLFWIVGDVFYQGVPNWEAKDWLFTYQEYDPYSEQEVSVPGIIGNTLVFTLVLVLLTITISVPFSFGTAVLLSEYARENKFGKSVRFFIDSLGGTPSILFGIFGVLLFRDTLLIAGGGLSVLAAALTMVLVIIPTFTRSIEQSLVVIPDSYRNASYALGASKFETIRKVVVPNAIAGIATGTILSAGRIIAETAPVYLLIGMMGNTELSVLEQGWTMTTRILYLQIYDSQAGSLENTIDAYKIASAAILLIGTLVTISEFIEPLIYKVIQPSFRYVKKRLKKALQPLTKFAKVRNKF